MNGDVPRIGSDDTLVPGQQSRNDHGVGLGAAREEEHVGGLVIASRTDAGRRAFAKAVAAIARRRLQVRRRQRLKNARMGTGGIVVLERDHESSSGLPGDVRRAIIPQRRRWWRKAVREMAIDKVKAYFAEFGREGDVMEFPTSSATVELAAQAVSCEPARIAKTLSFAVGDRVALVVCAGDARIANPKFKAQFGTKPRMLPAEEAEERVGHARTATCTSMNHCAALTWCTRPAAAPTAPSPSLPTSWPPAHRAAPGSTSASCRRKLWRRIPMPFDIQAPRDTAAWVR